MKNENYVRVLDKEDLLYLLSMVQGYIDDELGGFEEESQHTIKFNYLLKKYDIDLNEIKMIFE